MKNYAILPSPTLFMPGLCAVLRCKVRLPALAAFAIGLSAMWSCRLEAQLVAVQSSASTSQQSDVAARSLAALDLAILAAESGIPDVSFEAVRRAVGNGPPVSAVDLGGLLSPNQGQSGARYSGGSSDEQPDGQAEVASRLVKVHQAWQEHDFDSQACYQVLKTLVFPPKRPSDAFTYASSINNSSYSYSLSLSENEPEAISSGASLLVEWAKLADKQADLRQTMLEREKFPGARAAVQLLKLILAGDDPSLDAEALCEQLSKEPNLLVSGRDARLLMSTTYEMLQSMPVDSTARKNLWSGILASCATTERWAVNDWLKYAILNETRQALRRGDRKQFLEHANVVLTILAPLGAGNADYVASTTSRFYGDASKRAFDAGHLELGIECLKLQSSFGAMSSTAVTNQLVKVNSNTRRNLMKLTSQERFDILFDLVWSMPLLGLDTASQAAPRDHIPEPFIRGYQNYRKTKRLPLEQVTGRNSRSISLLEWAIRDALAIGQLEQVNARIAALEANGSDDAPLAKLVLAKAQDQPLDLSLVRSQNDAGQDVLRSDVRGRGPLLPLDWEIAAAAISAEETRQLGVDLAERLAERGLQNRTNDVLHGRMLVGLASLEADRPPASSRELVHFIKADDFSGGEIQSGLPERSLWLEKSPGSWEHQASTFRSSLLLKYPLLGNFEIGFRCSDETYGESGTTFCGLYMDFRGYVNDVALDTLGIRTAKTVANQHIKRGDMTAYVLKRDSDAGLLTLVCEGETVATMQIAAEEFPFYGFQSMMHRKMTTENLQILGDVRIPRVLELVTPELLGWSARFKGRRLPPVEYLADQAQETAADQQEEKSADLPYEWHNVDGVIESVHHERLIAIDEAKGLEVNKTSYRRREEWLYYLRPLGDGEQVSFEFYQEAGMFSVHPTIDRMAIWFDEPQLRQHWITCDGGSWFGVSSTNRVPAPKKQVLGQVTLQENAWNQASLQRVGQIITLSVNGQEVYEQRIDDALGGRFGFFHDPTLFQVRLRNIRLSGKDWPERLPDDLFEKRDR